ncbi:uncharacterized protein BO95DRAFT_326521, partial [Aspergillus brunneoviolaceus CBS 621.78]
GIIERCVSPWSSKTTFPRKSNGKLRMVHQYLALNDAIVKMAYLMRRIEPILNSMALAKLHVFFKADAADGYWAVPL